MEKKPSRFRLSSVEKFQVIASSLLFTLFMYFFTDTFTETSPAMGLLLAAFSFITYLLIMYLAVVFFIRWVKEKVE